MRDVEVNYRSDFLFELNASQMALCVRLLMQSNPTNAITGCGVSNNSLGKVFTSVVTVIGRGCMTCVISTAEKMKTIYPHKVYNCIEFMMEFNYFLLR